MLEIRIRSRGLAPGCCFATLRGGAGGPSERALFETGRNTAFGAFPVYVGATMISGFVATALLERTFAPCSAPPQNARFQSAEPHTDLNNCTQGVGTIFGIMFAISGPHVSTKIDRLLDLLEW